MKNLAATLATLALVTVLAACGNGTGRSRFKASKSGQQGGNTASYYLNSGLSTCSAQNVVPDDDRHFDGSGYYVGCWLSPTQLRLRGRSHYGNYVCVIPSLVAAGQYYNTAQFWYLQNQTEIYSMCGGLTNEEVTINLADLGATAPNAIFVVEVQFLAQAKQILSSATRNYALMPEFSYGTPGKAY